MAQYKRVGVVSVVGRELTQRTVGAREAADAHAVRDIAPWAVDRAYEEQIAVAVQAVLGVVPVQGLQPGPALIALNQPSTPYVQPGFWAYRTDPVAAGLRAVCASNGLDALVVASQSSDEDALGGTYQPLAGAGLYVHGGSNLVHLSAELRLVECATGRTVEQRRVASGRSFAASHGYPVRAFPAGLARKAVTQWAPAEDAQLKEALIALPAAAWVDTLDVMVHPASPPVSGRTLLPNS